ncbi:CYCLIN-D1-1 [Salix purpurea]|uniref:B-like cyclin n=1 Tax=Salix purpurea TaxID=77065 RepID=A0A9Q0Z9B1_SALPP|nr:CYCLIN-D1-1 [Salix purpurea]
MKGTSCLVTIIYPGFNLSRSMHPLENNLLHAYYGFQPLTAYLSVNYLDRFLYSRRLPQTDGWPLQLLSVACLSLAAKMEEPLVPSLLDLQVEGAKYIFEPRTIRRMELLVLGVLDWRLRSITPFSFTGFFACKLDPAGAYTGFLISRATEIILSNIKEASFLEYGPSSIAAAAIRE